MTIGVHISISRTYHLEENFNYNCLTALAGSHPDVQFIFIFDRQPGSTLIKLPNITTIVSGPQISNRLLGYYWYNFKLPSLLKKYNAAFFIGDAGQCCLRTDVNQCMIVHDLAFLEKQNLHERNDAGYLKKNFKKFLSKASRVAVTNHSLETGLKELSAQENKIGFIGDIINLHAETPYDSQQKIKEQYTEGKEYFISYITEASASNSIVLLKAFSAFKKRQLSNMQLVLILLTGTNKNPLKGLETYKYRNEVKVISNGTADSVASLSAAAYAGIYLPAFNIRETHAFTAIENNVAVITADTAYCRAMYGEAASYSYVNEKELARHMMMLYKDEYRRKELIGQGKLLAAANSIEQVTHRLWNLVEQASQQ